MNHIGKKLWVVPDGYIPALTEADKDNQNGYLSHECACILNCGPTVAEIELTIYFENCDPVVITNIVVPAERSLHLRMDELEINGKAAITRAKPYSMVLKSSIAVTVQMSRLDTTQTNMAFLSTMAIPYDI